MNRNIYISLFICLLFLVVCGAKSLIVIDIPSPGATGMNSQSDYDALRITDSRENKNVDVTTNPGKIQRRKGLNRVGADASNPVYSLAAYYNPSTFRKLLIGVFNFSEIVNWGKGSHHRYTSFY
jgi:hypothetical protein